ncbi:MAG: response regulator transcription factor [Bryobacteraceae bacterium]
MLNESRYHSRIDQEEASHSRADMEQHIRIVLANQHPIIRGSLRLLLERQPAFRVIGEAADGREAVVLAEYRRPEIVLLDIKLPYVNGIAAAREICSNRPGLGIVFVTALTDQEYISEAFKAGARGYVLGDAAAADLSFAIQVVAGRGAFISPTITAKLIEDFAVKHASERVISEYSKQLFCLLAAGYGEHEIAVRLNSSVSRIKADYQSISETFQRIALPEVIVDSIRGNHHFAGQR